MFKRLTTAVLALGLVIAFAGAAISGPDNGAVEKTRSNTHVQSPKAKIPVGLQPQSFRQNPGGITAGSPNPKPGPNSPDTTACYEQDYTDYAGTSGFFAYTRRGTDLRSMAMRFDVSNDHRATINGAYMYLYLVNSTNIGADTTVNVLVKVWSDAGGIPGAVLYTQMYSLRSIPSLWSSGGAYYYFPFTVPPTVYDQSYHISFAADPAGPLTDTLRLAADDGGPAAGGTADPSARGSYYPAAGPWFANTAILAPAGNDPNWVIISDQCEHYTSCFRDFGGLPAGNFVEGWSIPDPTVSVPKILQGFGQRFVATGPETIKIVHVRPLSAPLFGLPALTGYSGSSTNGLTVNICADNGLGGVGATLGTVTVPAGLATMFPLTGNTAAGFDRIQVNFAPQNLVVLGPYHVTINMTTSNDANGWVIFGLNSTVSSPGFTGGSVNFVPPTPNWKRTGTSTEWLTGGGGQEQALYIQIDVCKDEFAACQTQVLYGPNEWNGGGYFIGSQQHAQKVLGLPVNRVDRIRFSIADETAYGGNPGDNGLPVVEATIYADAGALPGALVHTESVPVPLYYPGWNQVVIPGGYQVLGDFYVGFRNTADPNTVGYIYAPNNTTPDAEVNGGAKYYSIGLGIWRDLGDVSGANQNWLIEVDFCSIPVPERACTPEANWATRAHDMQRTGASGSPIGDAYCDLNLTWMYEHPTQLITFAGPIIYNGMVICSFTNEYRIFNLTTGATLDVLNSADDAQALGGNIRCTPTVVTTADSNGVNQTYLYLAGGNTNAFSAWDIDILPATLAWKLVPANAWKGHGAVGGMRYGTATITSIAGQQLVFFADDGNKVFCATTQKGLPYAAFDGSLGVAPYTPFALGGAPLHSGSTDGVRVYYSVFVNGGPGDIVAINCANGTQAWRLSVATGLQGTTLYPVAPPPAEGFQTGPSVDLAKSAVYANSVMQVSAGSQFPADGVFYNLKATDGTSLAPAAISNRTLVTHPIIDANRVILLGQSVWVSPPSGGDLLAFGKGTNALAYAVSSFPNGSSTKAYTLEGALTCEPSGAPDYVIAFNRSGYLGFFNADNGDEVFNRRIDYGALAANIGYSSAIGQVSGATWVVSAANFGALFAFKKGADRSRLEILQPSGVVAVPFGSPADTVVTFADMYTNTGCTNLIVSLTADASSNGTLPLTKGFGGGNLSAVRERMARYARSIAERLTDGGDALKFGIRLAETQNEASVFATKPEVNTRTHGSRAALALPAFLNQNPASYAGDVFFPANGNIVTLPGDTSGISVHVNGPLVNRGPNNFYVEFTLHNDPDYFLSDNTERPEVFLTLVGGCLVDTTTLHFGLAGANDQLVWNTSRTSDGDATPHFGFNIDGSNADMFQGGYVYGISQFRLAMHIPSWQGGATPADDWISAQPDPNYCDADCKPALTTNVVLGSVSSNGLTYNNILGNVVCKSYIDSVVNYFDGSQWNWGINPGDAATFPFDNDSTIGLYANTRTVGALNDTFSITSGYLNKGTIEIMEFRNRNATVINNWKLWSMTDYDLGAAAVVDSALRNGSISSAWASQVSGDVSVAMGVTKIPFGCGYTPLINVKALNAAQAQFDNDAAVNGNAYFDSAYGFASAAAGQYSQTLTGSPDQEAHMTLTSHNFSGLNDTFSVAVVNWRLGVVDARISTDATIAKLANMFNKFAGFGRGDVNNDGVINLADIMYLADDVNFVGKPGPIPFQHLGDVDISGTENIADVQYLIDFYFNYGPCPKGTWEL